MLIENDIIKRKDGQKILESLMKINREFEFSSDADDIHMAIEESVIKNIGIDIGGNLNIGKSRNDQVSTALRMTLRLKILELSINLLKLLDSLIVTSKKNLEKIIPGYTHLQPAQWLA